MPRPRHTTIKPRPGMSIPPLLPQADHRFGPRPRGLTQDLLGRGQRQHYIEIDNSAGTPRNLSPWATEVINLGISFHSLSTTGVGETGDRIIATNQDTIKVTIKGRFDDRPTTGPDAVLSGIVGKIGTISYGPAGKHTGARRVTGEFLCLSYRLSSTDKGETTWEATFQNDGTVTLNTW